ncbi:uncharacterized protein LOC103980594 [Musa acuminata AAA Group]|uniref:uncharacterized protein LOC103980594 n=1 Tax=Musa acuminata AAA Group TaxID=214697 RepID=UPI0031E05B80
MKSRSTLVFDSPLVPKSSRRPRTRKARRSPLQGSLSELLNSKDGSASGMTDISLEASIGPLSIDNEKIPNVLKCSISWDGKDRETILESVEVPVLEVESVDQISLMDTCKTVFARQACKNGLNSNDRVLTHSLAGPAPFTVDGSLCPTGRNGDSWLAPGSTVWAKTAYHDWWPAEVMDERSLECTKNNHIGHILVQLYGSKEHAWLEPARDLSEFDYCYEERSRNPLQAFQDALKQALCKHVHTSPRTLLERCLDNPKSSYQHDKLGTWQTSSNTSNNSADEGRSLRKRKMKVHFDELTCAENPKRRNRRLRIMRYLGLMAPVGSPFSLQH